MTIDLSAQRVLVTGAGSGIGAGICQLLIDCGASVAVNDMVGQRAQEVAAALADGGGAAFPVAGDISSPEGAAAVVGAAVDALGGLDALVNNAGILRPGALADLPAASWREVLDVNLSGVFYCSQQAFAALADGGGAVVNLSSVVALSPPAGAGAYTAAKAGVFGLTRHQAVEWGPHGIRANAVLPGLIPGTQLTPNGGGPAELHERRGPALPLGRVGTPADVAGVVAFLVSDLARYVTGQGIAVDGGLALGLQALLPS